MNPNKAHLPRLFDASKSLFASKWQGALGARGALSASATCIAVRRAGLGDQQNVDIMGLFFHIWR